MKYALPVLAALLLASTAATVAHAQQVPAASNISSTAEVSTNFQLALNFDPDVTDWLDRSDIGECNPDDSGAFICILEGPWTDIGAPLSGTVTDPATGATGTLSAICSIDGYSAVSFSIAAPSDDSLLPVVDLVDAGGKVRVDCAWRMRMNDPQRSLLVGRALTNTFMTAADPASAIVRLNDNVSFEVAAGTGVFAGLTGIGTTNAQATFPMLGSSGELPIDFELVSLGGSSRSMRAASTTPNHGDVGFNLRASRDRLRISAPQHVTRRDLGSALIGQTTPGAACAFKARNRNRTVSLGSSRADNDGFVRLNRNRASSLAAGKWRISGACKADGRVARATTKLTVER